MMTDLERAVEHLTARAWRRARRLEGRDLPIDPVDADLDHLHAIVTDRPAGHPALHQLETDAGADPQPPTVQAFTGRRARRMLRATADADPLFAADLEAIVTRLATHDPRPAAAVTISVTSTGNRTIILDALAHR